MRVSPCQACRFVCLYYALAYEHEKTDEYWGHFVHYVPDIEQRDEVNVIKYYVEVARRRPRT